MNWRQYLFFPPFPQDFIYEKLILAQVFPTKEWNFETDKQDNIVGLV